MAKKRRIVSQKFYNSQTLHKEREYGFYWYSGLWKLIRPLLIFSIALVICAGVIVSGWNKIYEDFLMPVDPNDSTEITFRIKSGSSVTKISNNLLDQGFIRNKGIFKILVMFQGVTNKISYGDYLLSRDMTPGEIIAVLTSGTQITERTITIIPGWTVEDIADYFVKVGALDQEGREEFLALCRDSEAFMDVSHQLQQAGRLSERSYALEGYLAPDTYRVLVDADASSLIKTLLSQTEIVLDKMYDASAETDESAFTTDLTQDEIIILASIIEKEAAKKEDFGKVSAIFHNRLKQGMRLESDPTAKYTDGATNMVLTSEQVNLDTPYNTYVISGLPAGPICNPSPSAIEAALHPNQSFIDEGYLYFCSKDPNSGELHFSKTLAEHEAAVAEYRPLWEAFDEEQRRKAEEEAAKAAAEAAAAAQASPSASVDPSASADPNTTAAPAQ